MSSGPGEASSEAENWERDWGVLSPHTGERATHGRNDRHRREGRARERKKPTVLQSMISMSGEWPARFWWFAERLPFPSFCKNAGWSPELPENSFTWRHTEKVYVGSPVLVRFFLRAQFALLPHSLIDNRQIIVSSRSASFLHGGALRDETKNSYSRQGDKPHKL